MCFQENIDLSLYYNIISIILAQLLNELQQSFRLTYNISTFLLIAFSILYFFGLSLTILFHKKFQQFFQYWDHF